MELAHWSYEALLWFICPPTIMPPDMGLLDPHRCPVSAMVRHVICRAAALLRLSWHESTLSARLVSLNQPNGAAIAVTPLMCKRIGRVQLFARREKEEGSADAVGGFPAAQFLTLLLLFVRLRIDPLSEHLDPTSRLLPRLVELVGEDGGRQAGDRHSMAPCWVQSLLAQEIEAPRGKTEGAA